MVSEGVKRAIFEMDSKLMLPRQPVMKSAWSSATADWENPELSLSNRVVYV